MSRTVVLSGNAAHMVLPGNRAGESTVVVSLSFVDACDPVNTVQSLTVPKANTS